MVGPSQPGLGAQSGIQVGPGAPTTEPLLWRQHLKQGWNPSRSLMGRHWCQTLGLAEHFPPGRAVPSGLFLVAAQREGHGPDLLNCHTYCKRDSCLQTQGRSITRIQWIVLWKCLGFFTVTSAQIEEWRQAKMGWSCSHSTCPLSPFFRLCLDTSQDLEGDGDSSNHSAGQGFAVCFCISVTDLKK